MKRRVVCFFSFILLLFVFFTLVSPKVEDEMITLVDAKKGVGRQRQSLRLGKTVVVWQTSKDALFVISEGTGWEEGLRVSALPSDYYDDLGEVIELGPGTSYWYVFSASREPVSGSAVRIVEMHRGQDRYLIWHPKPYRGPNNFTNTMQVEARTKDAVLITASSATFPFFEHNLWFRFRLGIGDGGHIYSLHDTEEFIAALPWIAGVAAALLGSLILLGAGWRCTGAGRRSAVVWIVNLFLIAALFAALPYLQGRFDLPASLMPPSSILDLSHYRETFSRITEAMDTLGVPAVGEQLSRAGAWCAAILGAGVVFACAVAAAEAWLCRRRTKAAQTEQA